MGQAMDDVHMSVRARIDTVVKASARRRREGLIAALNADLRDGSVHALHFRLGAI